MITWWSNFLKHFQLTLGLRHDNSNYYGKVGYKVGKWAFSVDGAQSNRVAQNGDEATSFGGAVVWNIWESVQFYGCYRYHELDQDNPNPGNDGDPEDIAVVRHAIDRKRKKVDHEKIMEHGGKRFLKGWKEIKDKEE